MKILLLTLTIALAGCHFERDFAAQLQPFVGHDVQAVVKYLGYPGAQRELLDRRIYTWAAESQDCTLEVITDMSDIVRSYQWDGSRRGCARYTDRLPDPAEPH